MCTNCVTTAQAVVGQAAFAAYVLKDPVHRLLAHLGVTPAPDPVAHDVRTVAFLRSLDLDPVAVLGAETVAAAAVWVPAPAPARRQVRWARRAASARPIGSHNLATVQ